MSACGPLTAFTIDRPGSLPCDHSGCVAVAVHPLPKKYFASPFARNTFSDSGRPASHRGAYRDRHERWVRDAVDAGLRRKTSVADADGEVVWSWRLDAGVNSVTMLTHRDPRMVTKKPDHQREREGNRKTIAQGRPARSANLW
jgi:hypothetical protein